MVKILFVSVFSLLTVLAVAETTVPAADTKQQSELLQNLNQPLADPPAAPLTPQLKQNSRLEDFFIVSITALPFTAIWSFLGATTVLSVEQGSFPRRYTDSALTGAGSVALGSAVAIGLISIQWGKGAGGFIPPKYQSPPPDDPIIR